jgi:hypothetical protein
MCSSHYIRILKIKSVNLLEYFEQNWNHKTDFRSWFYGKSMAMRMIFFGIQLPSLILTNQFSFYKDFEKVGSDLSLYLTNKLLNDIKESSNIYLLTKQGGIK